MSEPNIGDFDRVDDDLDSGAPLAGRASDSSPAGLQRPPPKGGGEVLPFFLAALLGAIAALWGNWFFFDDGKGRETDRFPEFVVVESDTLLQAKIQETIMSGVEQSEQLAQEFKGVMDEAFKVYTSRGISVLHKNALMAFPAEYDVTLRVAEQLGIPEATIVSVREFQRTGELPQHVIDRVAQGVGVEAGMPASTSVEPTGAEAEPSKPAERGRSAPPSFMPLIER